ncbi:lantibiotic dehydratase C-terminal domain-containing protein [Kutzneria sp. 744]|uniref:lantibiotic dehydratase C-terminal domain-containing protein n=1 Tax=Kutzneria sp. (strain 744) TaxID=345341 RepID=UPI0012FA01F2|nr:lantibiotic dehydratase C-terminal domain-containing protein [Kutzneria sp. 744]
MPSNWLFVRLCKPQWMDAREHTAAVLPSIMSDPLDRLRLADPTARWAFRRRGAHVDLWFTAAPEALDELTQRLRAAADRAGVPTECEPGRSWTPYPQRQDGDVAVELADASSDLALDLLADGELDADGRLFAAVRHLENLTDGLDGGARTSLLFHCWQQWAGALSPAARVDVVREADSAVLKGMSKHEEWARYRARVESAADVAGYVLLDHAHLTHNQLGIDARTEALAARVVRLSLVSGVPTAQLLVQPA